MPRRSSWAEVERQVASSDRWLLAALAFLIGGILAALILNTGINGVPRTGLITALVLCIIGALLTGLVYQWKWARSIQSIRNDRKARQSRTDTALEPRKR